MVHALCLKNSKRFKADQCLVLFEQGRYHYHHHHFYHYYYRHHNHHCITNVCHQHHHHCHHNNLYSTLKGVNKLSSWLVLFEQGRFHYHHLIITQWPKLKWIVFFTLQCYNTWHCLLFIVFNILLWFSY